MRFYKLIESSKPGVAIIFGRFNPPHKGHRAAWEMMSQHEHWYVGTNKSTQGPKDPLPYDVKIKAMSAVMPEVQNHIQPYQNWFTMAADVYAKHPGADLYVYSDEDWVLKGIEKYNGKTANHGNYAFKNVYPVTTPRLSSATAVRKAAAENDAEAFEQAAGVRADTVINGVPYMELVQEYLAKFPKKKNG